MTNDPGEKRYLEPRYDEVFFDGVKWLDEVSYVDEWDVPDVDLIDGSGSGEE